MRCMMHRYGLKIFVIIFTFVIIIFAVWFRIFEVSNLYYELEEKNNFWGSFYEITNCIWIVIVSMSTSKINIFILNLFYFLVGFGDKVPYTYTSKLFIVMTIIFGVWVLSILVANLTVQITLNDEENMAYKTIEELSGQNPREHIHNSLKYLVVKNKILSSEKINFFQHLPHYCSLKETVRKDIKLKFQSDSLENKIKTMIESEHDLFEVIKLNFLYRFTKTNKKLTNKLYPIVKGSKKLLEVTEEARNVAYSTNNLAKCLVNFKTIGNISDFNQIENKKLFSFNGIRNAFSIRTNSMNLRRKRRKRK